jgi:hypothetical protein
MKLQTIVEPKHEGQKLDIGSKVLLLGSCFTDSIGRKMEYFGFQCCRNPFGILYNPFSIATALEHCIASKDITEDDLVCQNNVWHSWLHHSSFSDVDKDKCLENCNDAIHHAHNFMKHANYVIITWGTALVYTLKEKELVVGNCHKMPGTMFHRGMASVADVVERYTQLVKHLQAYNHQARIIFTVSPIRHWKEGYRENLLSKSVLHLAIDELQRSVGGCLYFPSYEIVMDELRDYRFYDVDMLHPSTVAVEIIWEKFLNTYTDERTRQICGMVDKYRKMKEHRPFFPEAEEYKKHLLKTEQLETELRNLLGRDITD